MASAAEQLVSNFNFGSIGKAKELQKRIWFTLFALIVYRLGTYIPLPGVDPNVLATLVNQHKQGILGVFDVFSGGALSRMTIFALNIIPYISASIIMQLMVSITPSLATLRKEGQSGRTKINQYTRYGTVFLAAVQSYGMAIGLEGMQTQEGLAVMNPGFFFRLTTVITLTGGTIFLMWLGEQITQRGVGNGISLIIFSGIVANLPLALAEILELGRTGSLSAIFIVFLLLMAVSVVAFIVFMERAHRRILIQYPKRQVGNRMSQAQSSHLPMKLNPAGVIPPIFATSLLLMPWTIAGFAGQGGPAWLSWMTAYLGRGQPLYLLVYVSLIVFFALFYTRIVFNPEETAENLRQYGSFVPGYRPGPNTAAYLDKVLIRLTTVGAAYLSVVCILPEILISKYAVPFYFGGTSLLIVVSVSMDTVSQINAHLMSHQYEGLLKRTRFKGRRGR